MTIPTRRRRRPKRYTPSLTLFIALAVCISLTVTAVKKLHSDPSTDETTPHLQTNPETLPSDSTVPPASSQPSQTTDATDPEPTLPPSYLSATQSIRAFAAQYGLNVSDYPDKLVQLLERNPETAEYVLKYPLLKDKTFEIDLSEYKNTSKVPLLMQWDQRWGYIEYAGNLAGLSACGPTCLSMVAIYWTKDTTMTPAYMIQFADENNYSVNGQGSPWTLFSQGAVKLGFQVKELPLVKAYIIEKLEKGIPIVCSMGPGIFTTSGHYIVLTGVQDGKIQVNDPNSAENSGKLWSYEQFEKQIKNLWAIDYP